MGTINTMNAFHVILFIVYATGLIFAITRIPFLLRSGIRPAWLAFFFILHVAVGCLHNVIAWQYFPNHGDIWNFFQRSFETRQDLASDFKLFIEDNSTWSYFTHNGPVLVNLLLNLFSFDNLYINTLLFSFLVFFGNIALVRVYQKQFPKDPLTALTALLIPSTLFWTSCIHRDGAIYALLGLFFYYVFRYQTIQTAAESVKNRNKTILICLLLFAGLIYFRPAVALSLCPGLLTAWLLRSTTSRRIASWWVLAGILLIFLLLFLPGTLNLLPVALTTRQQEYQLLQGGSRLPLPLLDGTWNGIFRALPAAIQNGYIEPLPGHGGKAIYVAFAVELIAIWLLTGWAVIHKSIASQLTENRFMQPFTGLILIFALSGLLLVGLVVPFAGAIVRYRSIFLPFLLAPFLHHLATIRLLAKWNKWLSSHLFRD